MIRNLKALILVCLLIIATGMGLGRGASANSFLTESSMGTVLTGEDTGSEGTIFSTKGSFIGVECEVAKYSGTVSANETSAIGIVPKYEGCNGVFEAAPIDSSECEYIVHGGTTSHSNTSGGTVTDAAVDLKCEPGSAIVITDELCPITIGSQSGLHGVTFTGLTENGKGVLELTATIDNINYTTPADFFCQIAGLEEHGTDGMITGKALITGFSDKGTTPLTYQSTFTEGSQINIQVVEGDSFVSEEKANDWSLVGEGTEVEGISLKAGTAECLESAYKGTMSSSLAATLTLSPEFGECDAFGFSNAEIKANGCAYVLHVGESGSIEGSADIECPAGKAIEVIAKVRGLLKCKATIGAQTSRTTVTYTNEGSGSSRDLKIDVNLNGIKYTQDTGEGLGKCEAGTFENGEISASPTVIAENLEKKQVGLWLDNTKLRAHSEISDTTLIGEGNGSEEFVLKAGTGECAESGYKGTMDNKTVTELTVSPEFAECDAFGFSEAEIVSNGCAYVFHVVEEGEGGDFDGTGDIECSGGKSIEIVAKSLGVLKCRATIGAQSGLTGVTFTDEGAGSSRDVKIDLSMTGVKYTQDAGEGIGKCEAGSFEKGEIKATLTVIGENSKKEQVGIWIE